MTQHNFRSYLWGFLPGLMVAIALLPSCSKTNPVNLQAPYVDTFGMLTSHHWTLDHFWYDMNNNNRIDSGEIVPGLDFKTVYIFQANGLLEDSTAAYLSKSGGWSFLGNNKSSLSCNWDNGTSNRFNIIQISVDELVTKRLGTNETWYFVP